MTELEFQILSMIYQQPEGSPLRRSDLLKNPPCSNINAIRPAVQGLLKLDYIREAASVEKQYVITPAGVAALSAERDARLAEQKRLKQIKEEHARNEALKTKLDKSQIKVAIISALVTGVIALLFDALSEFLF